tara:strand:+ start:258 stop:374 length:117 start_codon:yes stop_codon:yes gene_type:complete
MATPSVGDGMDGAIMRPTEYLRVAPQRFEDAANNWARD